MKLIFQFSELTANHPILPNEAMFTFSEAFPFICHKSEIKPGVVHGDNFLAWGGLPLKF